MATRPFLAGHTVAVDQRGYFPGRHPRGYRLPRLRRPPARRSVPSPTTAAEWRAALAASQSSRPLRSASVLVSLHSWPAARSAARTLAGRNGAARSSVSSQQRGAPAAAEGSSVNSEENHEVGVAASACADAVGDGPVGALKSAGAPLRATARSVRVGARFVRSSVLGGAGSRAPAVLCSGAACRTEVVAALCALPAEYRSVIVETFFRGRNVPETADVLGVSADMVKARCYDALHALKHALAERGLIA
jgi:hypothetical protein